MARRQLIALGVGSDAIKHRIRCGRLLPVHDGVYAVGHTAETPRSGLLAALLAVGDDGVISHLAAAGAQGFRPSPRVIDVTSPRRLRSRPGLRLHCAQIDPAEVDKLKGIPLTSPARTLFDLATMLSPPTLTKAANEAFVLRLCTFADLHETLDRNAGRKGAAAFRLLLARLDPDGRIIRSPLEARLNAFLRDRGFPAWETNVRLRIGADVIEADVLWREQRVIVEADGRDPHLSPLTFASDRRRDRRLSAEGWHPVRVTSRDLGPGADELDADLRAILGEPPPRGVRPTLR